MWGILPGTANGRGFDAAGLLGRIAASVVLPASSHGQSMYLIDDQSALGSNPYIVIATAPQPWAHQAWPKIYRITLLTGNAGWVSIEPLYFYNVSTKAYERWHVSYLRTLDAAMFPFWLRGGETGFFVHTWPGGDATPSWAGGGDLIPNNNECEDQSHSGTSIDGAYVVSGDPTNIISGWFGLVGLNSQTTDANGYIHLSIINTTGTTYRFDLFRDAARTQRVASSTTFTGTTTGARTFTADTTYSPGVTGTLSNTAAVSPNTGISCRTRTLILQAGEGANITVGRYYFLMQFTHLTSARISWSQVVSKSGDTIVFESIRSGFDFGAGTFVSPNPLRHYFIGSHSYLMNPTTILSVALTGVQGEEKPASFSQGAVRPSSNWNYPGTTIDRVSPDVYGGYRVSHGIVSEAASSVGNVARPNIWGGLRDLVYGSATGITIMSNGRDEAGIDYLAGSSFNGGYLMFRDTETTAPG